MSQIDQFLDALKKALKSKAITYAELAKKLKISESSVKRILSSKSLTFSRLEEICTATEINFSEICKLTDFEDQRDQFYNDEQEKALADDPRLCHLYFLLEDGYKINKISKEYEITQVELQKHLLRLDKLNLIELYPKDRIRLISNKSKRFRKEGPLGKILLDQTRSSYLQSQFFGINEVIRFQMGYLSEASFNKVKMKLSKFLADIQDDMTLENKDTTGAENYGLLLAIRPWQYTWMDAIRKKTKKD